MVYYRKKKKSSTTKQLGDFRQYIDRSPFPLFKFVNFTYQATFQLSSSTTSRIYGTSRDWNLNALYDVDASIGGHQPYGYDQWLGATAPYQRYKVYSVDLSIIFSDPSKDGLRCAAIITNPSSNFTLSAKDIEHVTEAPFSATRIINNTGSQLQRISGRIPMHTVFQVSKDQFSNDLDTTTAGYGGSPGTIPKLQVAVADPITDAAGS